MTIECSCRLWPSPGMYAVTSKPFVSRTRATLRSAEFGFFGVVVYTRVHTPRFCGEPASAGTLLLLCGRTRGLRTNWLIVGMIPGPKKTGTAHFPAHLRNGPPQVFEKTEDSREK